VATSIHPTAIVEPGAVLGADCEIQAYAVITRHCQLGDRVVVYPHAVVGGDPQFIKFDRSTATGVRVGNGSVIREYATINRSIYAGKFTTLGENCFMMAGSHLGHDCAVGNNVVLANNALLAGHVEVGDFTFVGGGAAVHQFSRIGESVMIGGLSRITRDIAPFLLVAERDEVSGLNVVGIKRRGFSREAIRELKTAFRHVFSTTGNIRQIAAAAVATGQFSAPETRRFLEFFASGKRSFARPTRASLAESGTEST
jgi:UDP-N-acetylglucosamine acyltransferase